MNERPVAGTFRLDGMLQGPLPPGHGTGDGIRAWAASAKKAGLHFHLSVDGGTYSLVADPAIRRSDLLGGKDLETLLSDALDALLDLLPPPTRAGSFSTVRSEEFRHGSVLRTLYSVGADGKMATEQRSADVETGQAPPEITPVSLRRAALPALVAVDNKRSALVFRIKRGPGWQRAMEANPGGSPETGWEEFATLLAIHQGRLRVELFNKKHELLVTREIDIRALREKESIEAALVAKPEDRIASAVLRP